MKHKKELSLSIACFLPLSSCFMAWNQERDENLAALLPKKREDELSILVAGEGSLSEALLVPMSVKE